MSTMPKKAFIAGWCGSRCLRKALPETAGGPERELLLLFYGLAGSIERFRPSTVAPERVKPRRPKKDHSAILSGSF